MTATRIAERYGRTPGRRRRNRIIAIVAAVAFVIVFGAWAVWGGLFQPTASIESSDVGSSSSSNAASTITWQLSVDPGKTSKCALQAVNDSYSIVGWKVLTIPPSSQRTRTLTATIRTTEQAMDGLIYQCWLP